MAQLKLAFLGNPEVRHAGQLLDFRTRKTLALLVYLAMEGGMHSRDTLTTLFWPESKPESGRATLRSTLLYLRKALDHSTPSDKKNQTHLIVQRNALGFDFSVDHLLDCHILSSATKPDTAFDRLKQAAALYRDDFLTGFSLPNAPAFDDWTRLRREQHHLQMNKVFDRLSHRQFERGEIRQAVDTTNRWLALSPLRETAYRRLMQLHLAAGNRGQALQTYESCCRMLAQEFDVQPSPETETLAERIRAFNFTDSSPGRDPLPSKAKEPKSQVIELPLVGRSAEHSQLVKCYYQSRQGQPQTVIIRGEAGIGKTRLAQEMLGWAVAQGAEVLQGKAFETGGRLPYQPVIKALRPRLTQEEKPTTLLDEVWLAELSRLLPELRQQHPNLPPSTAEERTAKTRMFEAVARLGSVLARQKPLILFIDNLQWADAASLDLLQYLARRWNEEERPIQLIFSLRAEALIRAATLSGSLAIVDWLAGLKRDLAVTEIALDPLTTEATTHLVEELCAPASSKNDAILAHFSQWLYSETQGQPFYLSETIKALIEQKVLIARPADSDRWQFDFGDNLGDKLAESLRGFIAPGVREVVRNRLARLSATAFSLLAASAVLGQNFHFKQICHLAGVQEDDGLAALDELLAGRLLVETDKQTPSGASPYEFTHDKIRDVVYTEAGEARRRLFHQRAFALFEQLQAPAAELAHHALGAGLTEAALHHNLSAADEAMKLYAVHNAIDYYEQAHQLLIEDAELRAHIKTRDQRRLYERLGRAYELANKLKPAGDIYQEMLTVAQQTTEPKMEVSALIRLATIALHQNLDGDKAVALLHKARQVAKSNDDTLGLAEAAWNLSHTSFYTFDRQAGLTYAKEALHLARQIDDKDLMARSLNAMAYAKAGLVPQMKETKSHAKEAQTLYAKLGNRAMEVDCMALVGTYYIHTGRPRQAIEELTEAHTISVEIANPWGQVNTAFHLSQAFLECGQYGQALQTVQAGVETAREHKMTGLLVNVLINRGIIYRTLRAFDKALSDHQEAQTILQTMASPTVPRLLAVHLCADYALIGQWSQAQTYADQAVSLKDFSWFFTWFYAGLNFRHVIETLLHQGQGDLATQTTHHLGQAAGDNPRYRLVFLRTQADIARWKGETEAAISHLEAANALAKKIGLPTEQWQILAALGELHQTNNQSKPSDQALTHAAKTIQTLADTIPTHDLRQTFLMAPQVQQILDK